MSPRSMVRVLATATVAVVVITTGGGAALADSLQNDVIAGGSAGVVVGESTTVNFSVAAANDDGAEGCNVGSEATLTAAVNLDVTGIATANVATLDFTSCDVAVPLVLTGVSAGSVTVSLTEETNGTSGSFDFEPASFTLVVDDPAPADTPSPSSTPTVAAPAPRSDFIVEFVSGVTSAEQRTDLDAVDAVSTRAVPALRMHSASLTAAGVDALRANPDVLRVEADKVREAQGAPNDPSYDSQWALPKIEWDSAYGTVTPSGSATVAVLDTGVDVTADLTGKVLSGASMLEGVSGTDDANGHGTAMASIVAAGTDNDTGIAGVGYHGVSVMPVKVLGADGTGQDSDIVAGVVYAADHGADVILMSFSNPGRSEALQAAADYAWSKGVVLVAATGNDASTVATYPAGLAKVVGVSATDRVDALWSGSNSGDDTFLAAPGDDIATGAASITGTSAAAAITAASAALVRANDPSASNGVVVGRLARTADAAGTVADTGNGRVNLARALGDTSTSSVVPAGVAGSGGPIVGPYVAAANVSAQIQAQDNPACTTGSGCTSPWQTTSLNSTTPGWSELDTVPMRVYFQANQANASTTTLTLDIDHSKSGSQGLDILEGLQDPANRSSNVTLTNVAFSKATNGSGAETYTYRFDVKLTSNAEGWIQFSTQLMAGAHNFTGNSLAVQLTPGGGTLAFTKPRTAPGSPDLKLTKTAVSTVAPGQTITYSLAYRNAGTDAATGVQMTDVLPPGVTYVANSCSTPCKYDALTRTLSWKLGTINGGSTSVTRTYRVTVGSAFANNATFTNDAKILSAENDASLADNSSKLTTTVVVPGISGTVFDDANANGWDETDTGLAGATVKLYLDTSNTGANLGVWDAGDTQVGSQIQTPASGDWTFGPLTLGTNRTYFAVRTANPTGYSSSGSVAGSNTNTTTTAPSNDVIKVVFGSGTTGASYNNKFLAQVAQRSTTTTLTRTSGANPSTYGSAVTFTATVTATAGNPSSVGTVTFKDGTTTVCSAVSLSGNTATCTVSNLSVAGSPHSLTAEYSGTTTGTLYQASTSGPVAQTITAKSLAGAFTVSDKVYDGSTSASILTRSLTGVETGDTVTLTGGSATFSDKNVGTAKTVTGSGFTLSGTHAGNYTLGSVATTTAAITAKSLTGSFTSANKTYDGTTTATATNRTLTGVVGAEDVTLTGGTATFADKNVATNKTVTLTGATLSGTQSGNYTLGSVATTTADITAKSLTGSFTSANKTYDGTTTATATNRTLTGVVGAEDVTLTGGTATFGDKNVGTGKTVTLTGATLSGTQSGNYTLGSVATTTADITAKSLTGSFTSANKTYDGTTTATATNRTLTGVVGAEDVTLTGGTATFADKNVGTGKTVTLTGATLSGTQSGNYTLGSVATITADITAKPITVTADPKAKTYGQADPALTYTAPDGSLESGDTFTGSLTRAAGESAGSYAILQGTLSAGTNYAITYVGANLAIGAKTVTGSFTVSDKVYDGSTSASILTRSLTGVETGDTVTLTGGSATFSDKNVGTAKTVTGSGFTLSGTHAGNYTLGSVATTTAAITAKSLTGSFTSANKTYDGTTTATATNRTLTGVVGAEDVTLTGGTATFADKNVATNKTVTLTGATLSGTQSGNYTLGSVTTTTADITARALTVTADAKAKTYGEPEVALTYQVTTGTVATGDAFTGSLTREPGSDVGAYAITQGTLALSGNYDLSFVGADYTITARPITVSAVTDTKTYDGTTSSDQTPTLSPNALVGTDTANFTQSFDTKNVGTGKTLTATGQVQDGNNGNNYAVTFVEDTTGSITARALTVTADAKSKTYGEPEVALTYQVTTGTVATGDAFTGSLTREPGSDVGAYAITQGTLALSGNYDLSFVGADYTITARPITVSAVTDTKTYDGTTSSDQTPTLSPNALVGTDTANFTQSFDTKNVGTGKTLTATGQVQDGNNGNNYAVTFVEDTTGSITARALTVTADAKSKTYGEPEVALTYQVTTGTVATGDAFTGSLTREPGSDVGAYAITQGTLALSGNYDLSFVGADYTITARPITVSAVTDTKTYDGTTSSDQTPTLSPNALVGTDTANFTQSFDTKNVGTGKTLTATGQVQDGNNGNNYAVTFVENTTGSITAKSLTGSFTSADKTYDGSTTATATNRTLTGVVGAEDVTLTGGTATFADKNVATNKTVTLTGATLSGTQSGNYTLGSVTTTTADITAKPITVTADPKSKTYGQADPALTYTAPDGSLENGDTFTGSLTRAAGESAGSYAILQGTVSAGTNYAITYVTADFTIARKALNVNAVADSKTYGATDPTFAWTYTGFITGQDADTVTISGDADCTRTTGESVAGSPYTITCTPGTLSAANYSFTTGTTANFTVGQRPVTITAAPKSKTYGNADPAFTYAISSGSLAFSDAFTGTLTRDAGEDVGTYPITQGTVALSLNYALTYAGANLTITQRAVTITADPKSKTYGDDDPAFTYAITSGTLAYTDAFTGTLTRDAGEDVGTYPITQGTVALNANYALTYAGANLTITQRAVTITADPKSKTYGDDDPAFTYAITSGTLAYTDAFTGTLTRDAGEDVGTYPITQGTVALNANYALTYAGANLTITQRAVTITADPKSKTYGDDDPAFTYAITSGTLAYTDAFTGTLTRDAGEDVGTYPITQGTVALNANYALTYVGANLTIGQRPVTVTAAAKSKTYGYDDPAFTYAISSGSLAFSDAFTGTLTRDAGEDVGTYPITQGTVALNANYALTYAGANLTITQRAVTITAAPKSKTYGNADPAFTYAISSGSLAFSDAFTGTLTRDAGEDVGTYPITQGTVALNANYALTYVGANLTIAQRPITVTADPKSKTYGNADPAFTYAISSGTLAYTDAFTGTLTRGPGEDVGSYTIRRNTLSAGPNYDLTYVSAELTIGQATLNVNAVPKAKTYGDSDPAFTWTYTGFRNGDTSSTTTIGGSAGCTRVTGDSVAASPYTITCTAGSLSALNYGFTTGTTAYLTIGQRPVTVTAAPKSKTYGDADPALTYSITSGTLAYTDAFTGGLTRDPGENVGTYTIRKNTLTAGSNYDLTYLGSNLTIGKATLTVTAKDKVREYGEANPPLDALISGFKRSEDLASSGVTGSPTCSTTATATSPVNGSTGYPITCASGSGPGALAAANYDFAFVTGKLCLTRAPLVITAAAKTRVYGDANPVLTGSIVGLKNADAITASYSTSAIVTSSVGNYAITPAAVDSSPAKLGNYTLTLSDAALTVTRAPLMITAADKTRVYGEANPVLTGSIVGLKNTDAITASYSASATVASSVGNYAIMPTAVDSSPTKLGNYTVTLVNGNLAITRATLTVTADNKTREYGMPEPAFTATISGFKNSENLATSGVSGDASCSTVATYASVTGSYDINCSLGTLSAGNYGFTFAKGTLTITPRRAVVAYIGQTTFVSSGSSSTTAQVTLTASVADPDGRGNLVAGTVDFFDRKSNKMLASGVKVSPVSNTETRTGTATTTITLSTGQYGAEQYLVEVRLAGQFTNDQQYLADPATDAYQATHPVVTVMIPPTAYSTQGAASLAKLASAAGTYADATQGGYTLGMKYNSKGTNPQGQIQLVLQRASGTYYIKSNSISSLAFSGAAGSAPAKDVTIYTKASIYRIESNGTQTSIEGGVTLRVDAHEGCGTSPTCSGSGGDTIGFTVLSSKDSSLYYSNNWAYDSNTKSFRTIQQSVTGANGVVIN
ncbi:MBG domain-containing protein [Oryzobacter telluris]|uniref:MBG domain-containing protein n=1 Tax=Oryzobacter telluris TaxID=3149179 RepID=UPI00370D0431